MICLCSENDFRMTKQPRFQGDNFQKVSPVQARAALSHCLLARNRSGFQARSAMTTMTPALQRVIILRELPCVHCHRPWSMVRLTPVTATAMPVPIPMYLNPQVELQICRSGHWAAMCECMMLKFSLDHAQIMLRLPWP